MASHASDCAVHNAPAMPIGPCDCGAQDVSKIKRHLVAMINTELQTAIYTRDREARGLAAGDITQAEFQDYQNDVDFVKEVLAWFNSLN